MPKLGHITGSLFSEMMTQGRGKKEWGKTSLGLAKIIACQRLGLLELDTDGYTSPAMEWGNETEELAIKEYQRLKMVSVHGMQEFQRHQAHDWVGCHPDGLVGEKGMIEVKCPMSKNHIDNVLYFSDIKTYEWQLHGSLWVTGREWIDFVSFDPRVQRPLHIAVKRIKRDADKVAIIEERYKAFEGKVAEYTEELKAKLEE